MPHILPDILRPNLRIVFCGTAPGARSAALSAYYAGPGNKFWRTLHTTGLTPRLLLPHEFPLLPTFGLGLTDVAKSKSGSDASLSASDFAPAAFLAKIEHFAPHIVCFNGKRAAQEALPDPATHYGFLTYTLSQTRFFLAPSTSGAANGFWDQSHWQKLATAAATLSPTP